MAGDPVDVIVKVSQQYGLPPNIALATSYVETGGTFDPTIKGDNGTSFGLFQLHEGGELGTLSPQQAFDPETNAKVAIPVIAAVYHAHPNWSPGQIAAAAQRPKDPTAYAASVNAIYQKAQGNPAIYWAAQTVANGPSEGDPNNATTAIKGGAGGSTLIGQLGAWASTAIPGFSALSGVTKLAEIVSAAVTSQNFWLRIGEALLGIALIVVGLVLLFKNDIAPLAEFAALA